MLAANIGLAQADEASIRKPIMITINAGATQSFLDPGNASILSVDGQLSPLFYIHAFRYKPGFAFQTALGLLTHRYSVETISSPDRNLRLMYLDIPVGVRYSLSPSFGINAGLSAAVKLKAEADFDFETGRPEAKQSMDVAENMVANMKFSLTYLSRPGVSIGITYTKALSDLFNDGSDGKTFSYIDLQLGYAIFGTHHHSKSNDRLRNAGPKNGW